MSYYLTCAITKLPIDRNEAVYVIPMSTNESNVYNLAYNPLTAITDGVVNYTESYSNSHYKAKYGILEGTATDDGTISNIKDSFDKKVLDNYFKTDMSYVFGELHTRYSGELINPILKDYHVADNIYGDLIYGSGIQDSLLKILKNTDRVKSMDGEYVLEVEDRTYKHIYRYTDGDSILKYDRVTIDTSEITSVDINLENESMEKLTKKVYKESKYLLGIKEDYKQIAKELLGLRYMVVKKKVLDTLLQNVHSYGWYNRSFIETSIREYADKLVKHCSEEGKTKQDKQDSISRDYGLSHLESSIFDYYDITKILQDYLIELKTINSDDIVKRVKNLYDIKHIFDVAKIMVQPQISCTDEDFNLGIHKDLQKLRDEDISNSRYEKEEQW